MENKVSEFNKDLLKELKAKLSGIRAEEVGLGIRLEIKVGKVFSGFARIRRANSLNCDVQLSCYVPAETSLHKMDADLLESYRNGGFFLLRTHRLDTAVRVLEIHARDLQARLEAYSAAGIQRRGRTKGIPTTFHYASDRARTSRSKSSRKGGSHE